MSAPLQDAQFVRLQRDDDGASSHVHVPDANGAQGIRFACPCGTGHAVLVWFANPIGDEPPAPPDAPGPAPRWQRSGEALAALTLTPSIAIDCWHGYVRGGRTETAG